MEIPVKNAIKTWNRLIPTFGNVRIENVPVGQRDFETVVLHELGHALGLDHPNLAGKADTALLPPSDRKYTNAIEGPNPGDVFDVAPGTDGVIGTSDDVRGDDVNIHWFVKGVDNPFILPDIVDTTTWSVDLADLPNVTAGQAFLQSPIAENVTTDFRSTQSIAAGDVDGDGDVDVVAGNQSTAKRLYLNAGTAVDLFPGPGSDIDGADTDLTESVVLGDIDLDGDLDLLATHNGDPTRLYLNNGTASPFSGVTGSALSGSTGGTSLALGDIDADGDLDLVEGIDGALNKLYSNNGGAFAAGISIGAGGEPLGTLAVALGDVDGDGDLDLVVGNFAERNRLHLNTNGAFANGTDIGTLTDNTQAIALGDIDDDGDVDVVVGNTAVDRLYLNNGTANPFNGVSATNITTDSHNTRGIALGDVNLDGKLDVVAGNTSSTVNRLYLNNGTASPFNGVTGSNITNDANSTRSVALLDLNTDGYLDLIAGNFGSRNRIYLNRGPVQSFPVNGHLAAGQRYTGQPTETAMTPDPASYTGISKRHLTHDDVAMMLFARTGLDRTESTSDDNSFTLTYLGLTQSADITIEFDMTQTGGFDAATLVTANKLSDHTRIVGASVFFNESLTWFFNPDLHNASIFADFDHSGIEEGSQQFPFNSVAEAVDAVAIGGTIHFTTSESSETLTIDQAMTLQAPIGSQVRIGVLSGPDPSTPGKRVGFISGPPNR